MRRLDVSTLLAALGGLGAAALVALAARWPVLLLVAATVAAVSASAVLRHRSGDRRRRTAEASAAPVAPDRPLRPLPSWVIPAGAVAVAAVTWVAVWGLQAGMPAAGTQVERAQLRVEAIRTGLTIGAGVTAAFALLLAFRRQQLAERTQQATEYDAGEKRVTELYVKAAEQLGSEKAPVRLAGLYALERLAQDNPAHRQSIVEVICAYLRMPYTPPDDGRSTPESVTEAPAAGESPSDKDTATPDPREERQVRLAAQRILARHLRPETPDEEPDPSYWGPEVLDLTEAVLIEVDFSHCHLHDATFTGARFVGHAWFVGAVFTGQVRFTGAAFGSDAWFNLATFDDFAPFSGATFGGGANFARVCFNDGVWFNGATFSGGSSFVKATLDGKSYDGPVAT